MRVKYGIIIRLRRFTGLLIFYEIKPDQAYHLDIEGSNIYYGAKLAEIVAIPLFFHYRPYSQSFLFAP